MSSIKQLLIAARARISKPENWTQGTAARCSNGNPVMASDVKACQWCSLGTIALTSYSESDPETAQLNMWRALKNPGIAEFNDTHTHQEVLNVFDKAIASES